MPVLLRGTGIRAREAGTRRGVGRRFQARDGRPEMHFRHGLADEGEAVVRFENGGEAVPARGAD